MTRDLLLGVSPYHDSSVAVTEFASGKPLAVLSEDRHSGRSHHLGFPWYSLDRIIEDFGAKNFAGIGVPWDHTLYRKPPTGYFSECGLSTADEQTIRDSLETVCDAVDADVMRGSPDGLTDVKFFVQRMPGVEDHQLQKLLTYLLLKYSQLSRCRSHLSRLLPGVEVHAFNHHECHAELANFSSGESSWVLTMDGRGEFDATVLWKKEGPCLERLEQLLHPKSLGRFYELWSTYLGFDRVSGPGKLMGLASYGDTRFVEVFASMLSPDLQHFGYAFDNQLMILSQSEPMSLRQELIDLLGPPRRPEEAITSRHEAIAYGAQHALERVVIGLVQHAIEATGSKDGFLSGGVALNCVMNAQVLGHVDRLGLLPPCGDDGLSLGAAGQLRKLLRRDEARRFSTARYEKAAGTANHAAETESLLKSLGFTFRNASPADLADLIAQNQILAVVRGEYEFGPRALGNRSLFANPTLYENWPRINADVKFRDDFRPFAPILTEEFAHEIWVPSDDSTVSPFMLFAPRVSEIVQQQIPAVVHVDGTSRIQTVNDVEDAWLFEFLQHMSTAIGVPAVLNTSLNMAGESILVDIGDVLEFASMSAVDGVFVDGLLVSKKDNGDAFAAIAERFGDKQDYLARRPQRYEAWLASRVDRSTHLDFPTAFRLIWGFEATPNLLGKASFS